MPDFTLRLLHLSDLHERSSREKETWRRRRVLGDEWLRHLEEIQKDGPIDLVCFTGDAADWGLAARRLWTSPVSTPPGGWPAKTSIADLERRNAKSSSLARPTTGAG